MDELPFLGRKAGSQNSAQSQLELSNKIVNVELPGRLEEMDEPFKAIVKRCLVLDPLERVQSPDELLDLLHGTKKEFQNIQDPIDSQNIPEIDDSDMKTELVLPTSNTTAEEYSVPVNHAHTSVPDEQANYEAPKDNVTQFIGTSSRPIEKTPGFEEEQEPAFKMNMGGSDKGGFNYRHLIIIGAVLAVVVTGSIVAYQKWTSPNVVIQEPVEQKDAVLEVIELSTDDDFSKFNITLDEAKDAVFLTELRSEIDDKIESGSNTPNFELHYFRMRLEYFDDELAEEKVDYREISNMLNEAYKIAMKAPITQKALLNKMERDENGDLVNLLVSGRMKKIWNEVKTKLEK
jgi:serine/threonine protein kinase